MKINELAKNSNKNYKMATSTGQKENVRGDLSETGTVMRLLILNNPKKLPKIIFITFSLYLILRQNNSEALMSCDCK